MEIPKIIDGIPTDKNAKAKEGVPVYSLPKTNKQKSFKYVNMAVLFYEFESKEYDYLNFTVKLTLGIKNDGRHVQYSVNKVDIVKNKIIL